MGKPRSECNRDPERARKRAVSDLRCAVRKLGIPDAIRVLADLARDDARRPLADELDRLLTEPYRPDMPARNWGETG